MNLANRKTMCCAVGVSAALLLCAVLSPKPMPASEAAAQSGAKPSGRAAQDTPSPLPDPLLAEFIGAAREISDYETWKPVQVDRLQKELVEWQKEVDRLGLPRPLKLVVSNTESLSLPREAVKLADGSKWMLHSVDLPGRNRPVSVLEYTEGAKQGVRYAVQPRQLSDAVFTIGTEIKLMHPANQPLSEFAVAGKDLASVVDMLCKKGGLDHSIRSDLAGGVMLSLSLHNISPAACLQVVAKTAGWKLTFMVAGEPFGGANTWVADGFVDIANVLDAWRSPEVEMKERLNVPDWTFPNLLKWWVIQEARRLQEQRTVAVLEPADAAASAASPAAPAATEPKRQ